MVELDRAATASTGLHRLETLARLLLRAQAVASSQIEGLVVSPRRLDYAVGIFGAGGDLKDVLPNGVNLKELEKRIRSGSLSICA